MRPGYTLFRATLSALMLLGVCFCGGRVSAQTVGMDPAVDRAIDSGLAYLASVQQPDGSFPERFGKGGAISALAGMAFLAKGYTPGADRYGTCINRSVDYILSLAAGDGFLGTREDGNGRMYAHSICTLFLSEISGMVDRRRQKQIDSVLPRSVKILLDAQNVPKSERDQGGWRYQRNSRDSDMSCSGWALMALRSCRLNGGRVPASAIDMAVDYVKRHHEEKDGSFVYQKGGSSHALTLTGAGILCLELCGKHNDPASLRAARYLMENHTRLRSSGNRFYGIYYTAQGLFQIGGEHWRVFSDWMYRTWIPLQEADGSWSGQGHESSRPYATSLAVLAFAVPYRQLPIYQRDETVDED